MHRFHPSSHTFDRLLKKAFRTSMVLPEDSRAAMREALQEYAQWKPIRERQDTPRMRPVHSVHFRRYRFFAGAMAVVLICAGIGTSAASAHTLPKDLLYPIKVDVLEPVRAALTFSDEGKAAWQMTIATRRVQEAITLSNDGNLDAATANELSARFTKAADTAAKRLALADQRSNGTASIIPATHFSAVLSGYEMVLSAFSTTSVPHITVLQATVRSHMPIFNDFAQFNIASSTTVSPLSPESSVSRNKYGNTPAASHQLLNDLRKAAKESLNDSAYALTLASSSLTSPDAQVFSDSLDTSVHDALQADKYLGKQDTAHAEQLFKEVISNTTQLQVLIHNAPLLNPDVLVEDSTASSTPTPAPDPIQKPPKKTNRSDKRLKKETIEEHDMTNSSTVLSPTIPFTVTPFLPSTDSESSQIRASSSIEENNPAAIPLPDPVTASTSIITQETQN